MQWLIHPDRELAGLDPISPAARGLTTHAEVRMLEQAADIPWYASVAAAGATAVLAWFGGRFHWKRESASTDASVTGFGALKQLIQTLQSAQMLQAQEIERLRKDLSSEVSQIGRLRARVGHLEALLRNAGIPVPPEDS